EPDEDSLFDRALRLGWLNQVGVAAENTRERVYAFYHATFQEYFAALEVEDCDYFLPRNHVDGPVEGKGYRIFEPQWKQVILLWLGREDVGDEEKEGFIRGLVEFEDGCGEWNFEKVDRGFSEEKVDRGFYEYQAYFLAAAGINEFKACSLATDIVRQVVKWGCGEFDIQKQKWTNFPNLIQEGVRKAIAETIRWLAISELSAILENCLDEDIPEEAAWSLGAIGQGNPDAIAGLLQIIRTTEDGLTCWQAAKNLEKIGQGNPDAIAGLLQIIRTTEDGLTCWQAAESLGKIGQGNPEEIAVLLQIIRTTENEYIRMKAAESLGKIDPGNPDAIAELLEVIRTTEDDDTREDAANSMGKIAQGNPDAIITLVELMETSKNESTRSSAVHGLGYIPQGNLVAIAALIRVINNTKNNEHIWRQAVFSLSTIAQGNRDAIAALIRVLENTDNDENIRGRAVEALGQIGQGNFDAIAALIRVLENTDNDENIRGRAVEALGQIGQGNSNAIMSLVKIIENKAEHENIRSHAAKDLARIDAKSYKIIPTLISLIKTFRHDFYFGRLPYALGIIGKNNRQVINILSELITNGKFFGSRTRQFELALALNKVDPGNFQAIDVFINLINTDQLRYVEAKAKGMLTTPKQYARFVSSLKDCLSYEVYQNNFGRFHECYKLIWNCAKNLPYPEFYQAWHNPLTTPHPEVTEQTPVGHNLTVDSLETQPIDICLQLQNLPIFCLDATILTDETDPSEIAQTLCQLIWEKALSDEEYPKEVTTASKLREQLKTLKLRQNLPKLPILITHCHPSTELIVFCRKLTNIVAIAWLTDEPLEAPLKGFPLNQPHLISAIQTWLEEI
ncbi:MAG: HEAT repeat domain-containing protein, partial [Planktothrix sp.]